MAWALKSDGPQACGPHRSLLCESGGNVTCPQGGQGALRLHEMTHVDYYGQFLAQKKPSVTVSSLPPPFPFEFWRSDMSLRARKLNTSPLGVESDGHFS